MADELRADIAAAMNKMGSKVGAKRELKKLPDYLWEGETVERLSSGYYGGGTGLIAQTNQRLLFVKDGIMSRTTEDFPYSKISSIQWSSGMMMGKVTVFVSGNKAEITQVDKGAGKEMVDTVRARIANLVNTQAQAVETQAASAPTPPPDVDPIEQLKKLGELHQAGVLTSEEFEAKKAEMLRRL
jgi:hypothetical protein